MSVPLHPANLVGLTSAEWDELHRLRHTLGDEAFNEIQRVTWNQFIAGNEPPYTGVWKAFLEALRAAVRR